MNLYRPWKNFQALATAKRSFSKTRKLMQAKQTKTTTVLPQQNDETIPASVPFSPLSKHQGNSPFAPRSPLDPIPTVSEEKCSPDCSPLETPTLCQQTSYKTHSRAQQKSWRITFLSESCTPPVSAIPKKTILSYAAPASELIWGRLLLPNTIFLPNSMGHKIISRKIHTSLLSF